jgi:hypothetical protein
MPTPNCMFDLACPRCGEELLHHEAITVFFPETAGGPGVCTIVDGGQVRTNRLRSGPDDGHITISFWCGCCHGTPSLWITEHNDACEIAWGAP